MTRAKWRYLGCVSYADGVALQERVATERLEGRRPDTLLLLEHPPTITLGRRASGCDVLWSAQELHRRGIEVIRVGRGGGATYHGPGQLVGYAIARLPHQGRSVRRFVADLEDMLLEIVAGFGVRAERRSRHSGIWVGEAKLGSIGIAVRRGVSRHGFALNVDMDLTPFAGIIPCGTPGLAVADLSRAAGRKVAMVDAVAAAVRAWERRSGESAVEELREF